MALRSVLVLCDSPVIDTQMVALEETVETNNERIRPLESQGASKDAEMAAKVAQADTSEERFRTAGDEAFLMLRTICENGPPLRAVDVVCFSAEVALR